MNDAIRKVLMTLDANPVPAPIHLRYRLEMLDRCERYLQEAHVPLLDRSNEFTTDVTFVVPRQAPEKHSIHFRTVRYNAKYPFGYVTIRRAPKGKAPNEWLLAQKGLMRYLFCAVENAQENALYSVHMIDLVALACWFGNDYQRRNQTLTPSVNPADGIPFFYFDAFKFEDVPAAVLLNEVLHQGRR